MLPTLSLRLATAATNPPIPLGLDVLDGDKIIGVMTVETLRAALADWDWLQQQK